MQMDDAPPAGFTTQEWSALRELAPASLPAPPADVSNKYADDARAAALGQKLFFDPGFSGALIDGDNDLDPASSLGHRGETGKVSCAGCHVPSTFVDTRTLHQQISLASGWTKRRTRPLLDVGQAKLLTWDGHKDALFNQVFGPIESPVEMNSSRLYVAQQIAARYRDEYEAIFGALPQLSAAPLSAALTGCQPAMTGTARDPCDGVVHGQPGDHAEFDALSAAEQDAVTRITVNFGKAIGAYLRRLSCGPGRFDQFMHGDRAALSTAEQAGARLFIGAAGCMRCHSGPYLSDQRFHNVGLRPRTVAVVFLDLDDRGAGAGFAQALSSPLNVQSAFSDGDDGRLDLARDPAPDGAFRTVPLRCVSGRPSFMHTGQLTSLDDVVAFFSEGGDLNGFPGTSELAPLTLTDTDRGNLVAFLHALDGPGPDASLMTP
jgi:cytochrome c peroxidase